MRCILVILFLMPVASFACKCAKFNSPRELFEKSDFVFYGTSKKEPSNISGVSFEIQRLAKGNEAKLGSRKIVLTWAGDQSAQCRTFFSSGDYLVFAIKAKSGYAFLTDCYSEAVSVKDGEYIYKGTKQSHFDFFDVKPISAVNGMRPRYAEDLTESEAKELTMQHFFFRIPILESVI